MNSNSIKEACRVCLKYKLKDLNISIFEKTSDNSTIAEKIMICSNIQISDQNDLPYKICKQCLNLLDVAYNFRNMCKKSDNILQRIRNRNNRNNIIVSLNNGKTYKLPEDIKIKVVKVNSEGDEKINNSKNLLNSNDNKPPKLGDKNIEYENEENNENNAQIEFVDSNKLFEIESDEQNDDDDAPINDNDGCDDDDDDDVSEKDKSGNNRIKEHVIKKNESTSIVRIKINRENEKSGYICEICGNSYKQRCQLTLHMKRHRNEKSFACEICGQLFLTNALMARHLKRHTGLKPYKCKYCTRKFYENGTCRAHEKTHSGARPYICKICGKSFIYSQGLTKHMLIHNEIKLYSCTICSKEFRLKHHLTQHFQTIMHKEAAELCNLKQSS